MRSKLLGIISVAGAIMAAAPASAQTYDPRYPVCLMVSEWGGGPRIDCSFTSLAQCGATASGRGGSCSLNPFFAYAVEQPSATRYRRRQLY